MACKINQKLSITNFNTGNASRIKYIVIHYVGATGGAEDNCNYFYSTYRGASAHYFVGHSGEIWQCVLDKNIAWHCGTSGTYYHSECRNSNAIGIEMCCRKRSDGSWYFEDATVKSCIELTKQLMATYGIPADRVIRHYDVTHKTCPEPYVSNVSAWNSFKAQLTTTTAPVSTAVKTYKVVTNINKYATADDAKNKKNSKGTMTAGTYYVYNKYPDGYNGMYNISTDKTGNCAGSWINPAENVAPAQPATTHTTTMYRVRLTWSDAKSQIGAFSNLDNAKKCVDSNPTYKVFDESGKVVYEVTTSKPVETPKTEPVKTETVETPKTEVEKQPQWTLKFKIVAEYIDPKNLDHKKATAFIRENNPDFDENIAKAFFEIAPIYGIDPRIAICQSILETGWFKFVGSSVSPDQHNYCGLGAVGGGASGASFASIEDGVEAQCQHLFAYATTQNIPKDRTLLDPRFKYVTRGIATIWEELAGRWAVPGFDKNKYATMYDASLDEQTYGQKILTLAKQYEGFKYVTPVEPKEEVKDVVEQPAPEIKPTPTVEDNKDNVNEQAGGLLFKIVELIKNLLKLLTSKK